MAWSKKPKEKLMRPEELLERLERERMRVAKQESIVNRALRQGKLSKEQHLALSRTIARGLEQDDYQMRLEKNIAYYREEARRQKEYRESFKAALPAAFLGIFMFVAVAILAGIHWGGITAYISSEPYETVRIPFQQDVTESGEYLVNISAIQGLKLSGTAHGTGSAEIWLQYGNASLLVWRADTSMKETLPGQHITGLPILDQDNMNQTSQFNESANETVDEIANTALNEIMNPSIDRPALNETPNSTVEENIEPVLNESLNEKLNETLNVTLNESGLNATLNESSSGTAENETLNESGVPAAENETLNLTVEPVMNATLNETLNGTIEEIAETALNESLNESNETVDETVVNETLPETPAVEIPPELEASFTDACVETCLLSEAIDFPTLVIVLDNVTLSFTELVYLKERVNHEPVLLQNVSDHSVSLGGNISIDSSYYFSDPDGDELYLDARSVEGLDVSVEGGIATLMPSSIGIYQTYVYVTDGEFLVQSNEFLISVVAEGNLTSNLSNLTLNGTLSMAMNESVNATNETFNVTQLPFTLDEELVSIWGGNPDARPRVIVKYKEQGRPVFVNDYVQDLKAKKIREISEKEQSKEGEGAVRDSFEEKLLAVGEIGSHAKSVGAGFESASLNITELELLQGNEQIEAVYIDRPVSLLVSESLNITRIADAREYYLNATSGQLDGSGIKVCLIDTGVNPAVVPYAFGFDFVNNDSVSDDDHGHGTQVAYALSQAAPGASIISVKVVDSAGVGYESDVLAGLQYCQEQNASIVSVSIGAGSYSGYCDANPVAAKATEMFNSGALVVAASGNDGSASIKSPACAEGALAVGASTKQDGLAGFTSFNDATLLLAPGQEILTKGLSGGDVAVSGTSMSVPFVSGAAALLLQNEAMSPGGMRELLVHTGLVINDSSSGSSGSSGGSGRQFARLDAFNALLKNHTNNLTLGGIQGIGNVSNYTALETNVSSCQALNSANTTYTMNQSITNSGVTCFTISANNVTLNCQWNMIEGTDAAGTYGILSNGVRGTFITNCLISNFSAGIFFNNSPAPASSPNGDINATNLSSNGYGIIMNQSSSPTSNTLQNIWIEDSTYAGIFVDSPNTKFHNVTNELNYVDNATQKFYSSESLHTSSTGNLGWWPRLTSDGKDASIQLNTSWYNGTEDRGRHSNLSRNSSLIYWYNNAPAGILTSCPTSLSTLNGYYTMMQDITDAASSCFTITASGVTLDCRGYTIGGTNLANTKGIITSGSITGVTVKNCVVKSFQYGMQLSSGHSNFKISNLVLHSNYGDTYTYVGYGIRLDSVTRSNFSNITLYGNNGVAGDGVSYAGSDGMGLSMAGSHNNNFSLITSYSNIGGQSPDVYAGGSGYGIYMTSSQNNTFSRVTARGNNGGSVQGTSAALSGYGIYMIGSHNNTFNYINITANTGGAHSGSGAEAGIGYGVHIDDGSLSNGNNFTNGNVSGNAGGANSNGYGGYAYGFYIEGKRTTLLNITASGQTGGVGPDGGGHAYGVYLLATANYTQIHNSTFSSNRGGGSASSNGGVAYGLAIFSSSNEINNVNTSHNLGGTSAGGACAGYTYGVYISAAGGNSLSGITSMHNRGNTCSLSGGAYGYGIYIVNSPNIRVFYVNTSFNNGSIAYGATAGYGYGLISSGASAYNQTFMYINASGNAGGYGDGAHAGIGYGIYTDTLANSTLAGIEANENTGGYSATLQGGTGYGIFLSSALNNTIYNVTAKRNSGGRGSTVGGVGFGVYLVTSSNNIIAGLQASENFGGNSSSGVGNDGNGIYASGSNNTFRNFNATFNFGGTGTTSNGTGRGIYSLGTDNKFIFFNASSNSRHGYHASSSGADTNEVLANGTISNNTLYGIYLQSLGNIYFENVSNEKEYLFSNVSKFFVSGVTGLNTSSKLNTGWWPKLASNGSDAITQDSTAWYNGTAGGKNSSLASVPDNKFWFNNQPLLPIFTATGTVVSWVWAQISDTDTLRSGSPYNWSFRQYQSGSGRRIVNGTAQNWTWIDE